MTMRTHHLRTFRGGEGALMPLNGRDQRKRATSEGKGALGSGGKVLNPSSSDIQDIKEIQKISKKSKVSKVSKGI